MSTGGELSKILEVLAVVDGFFVLRGPDGEEYVVGRRAAFNEAVSPAEQRQLALLGNEEMTLPEDSVPIDEEWSSVGDIMTNSAPGAEMAEMEPLEHEDDLDIPRSAKKVSFEPIKGDLPPELQE